MIVKMQYDDTPLYEYECTDVSGLFASLKEVDYIHFDFDIFKYDYSTLNHYTAENGDLIQELYVYLSKPMPRKIVDKPSNM